VDGARGRPPAGGPAPGAYAHIIRAVRKARLLDPISDPAWLALLEGSRSATIFHHPRWLELLRSHYGYAIHARCIEADDGIEAGIPIARIESRLTGRRLVSLPFSDICPPVLAAGADSGALGALSAELLEERRRTGLELTVHASLPGAHDAFVQRRFFHHLLALADDPAEVESRYSKSQVKRGIKKALREGLRAERRTDVAALDAFYALHVRTRRKLGVPTQPKRFIREFAKLFEADLGFVELVLAADRPVAAAVFLTFNGTVTYKYGASDARELGKRPNNLLFSETIRWACEAGFETLDFGRTDADNEGLRAFKRSWGADEHELAYTYFADREPTVEPQLRDRLMSATIRHSPAGFGRLVGEALYRHFG
jgi:CelD/BcsL family acetyltransferase involved in cellulose biosynthesis